MPRPIYSTLLSSAYLAPVGSFLFFNGVAGQVVVIRSMDFTAPNFGPGSLGGFVVEMSDGTSVSGSVWYMGPGNTRGCRSYHWRGRAAMPAENAVRVTTFDPDWAWNISGYLLSP